MVHTNNFLNRALLFFFFGVAVQENHRAWRIGSSITCLHEIIVQCKADLEVNQIDEEWLALMVEVFVRNIRHALPYLLRRLLLDVKANNVEELYSVFSTDIQVEEFDTEHNPLSDLARGLVNESIDFLLALISFRLAPLPHGRTECGRERVTKGWG